MPRIGATVARWTVPDPRGRRLSQWLHIGSWIVGRAQPGWTCRPVCGGLLPRSTGTNVDACIILSEPTEGKRDEQPGIPATGGQGTVSVRQGRPCIMFSPSPPRRLVRMVCPPSVLDERIDCSHGVWATSDERPRLASEQTSRYLLLQGRYVPRLQGESGRERHRLSGEFCISARRRSAIFLGRGCRHQNGDSNRSLARRRTPHGERHSVGVDSLPRHATIGRMKPRSRQTIGLWSPRPRAS